MDIEYVKTLHVFLQQKSQYSQLILPKTYFDFNEKEIINR